MCFSKPLYGGSRKKIKLHFFGPATIEGVLGQIFFIEKKGKNKIEIQKIMETRLGQNYINQTSNFFKAKIHRHN